MSHEDDDSNDKPFHPHDHAGDRLTTVETLIRELRRWLKSEFQHVSDAQEDARTTQADILERVVRLETLIEQRDSTGPHKTVKETNPLNRTMGNFLGDALMTAFKAIAVAVITIVLLMGLKKYVGVDAIPSIPVAAAPPQPKAATP